MLHWLFGTRLEVPTKLVPVDVAAAVLALLVLLPALRGRPRPGAHRWRPTVVRAVVVLAAGGVGLLVCWIVGDRLDAFDVHLTAVTRMWVAIAFGGAALGVTGIVQGRLWRRIGGAVLVPVVVLAAALGVNVDFAAYPTLNALTQSSPFRPLRLGAETRSTGDAQVVSPFAWHAPVGMPVHGRVGSVTIPGRESGFPARKAVVYLPPAALTADPPVLPVLVSLSGQPGTPSDMFLAGGLDAVLDRYAATHQGLAPIVVSADQLAVPGHNPMCVDSKLGNAATYIMRDVRRWTSDHLRVPRSGTGWGVLGFSEGATCAMQFSAGHPDAFSSTIAISSELVPTKGDPATTVADGFGGSVQRWHAAWPRTLLAEHAPFRHHLVVLGYGQRDDEYAHNAHVLAAATRRSGMITDVVESPGSSHDWNTVHYTLARTIPLVATFMWQVSADGG
jgi:S-formylglutathione hydrolase FrmB